MKKFSVFLALLAITGVLFALPVRAATGYGHNVVNGVNGGSVGSECFSNGTAFSKAQCRESTKAIQVQITNLQGQRLSATSSGLTYNYTYTPRMTNAGSVNEHIHAYTVYTLY